MKKGEIGIIDFPFKGGREQSGKRPALILADTQTDLIIVIPLTSNLFASRFPNTLLIKKSDLNYLNNDSIALIFHIQAIDKKRLINKVGLLENLYINNINNKIKKMFQL